ncbi:hypothetical protein KY290_014431 [Solanum tuberosum]|uniref:Transcriptional regulator family protein n=1 Tax=Solanum tuberosum TaxID=4113 RepID=A0ABQ7VQA3_SOLTU|nr:hypothetical protein KY289_014480 [Solanum tuberosum]KAH0770450.1 hypothetical protein KY290_014431 [Solanum tuberosum]
MASQKKESEGIALLSIYGDDEDEDMEELEGEQREEDAQEYRPESQNLAITMGTEFQDDSNKVFGSDSGRSSTPSPLIQQLQQQQSVENFTPNKVSNFGVGSTTTTPLVSVSSPNPQPMEMNLNVNVSRRARLTIVDYAHDEVTMSPEPEEGEVMASGRVMYGAELQTVSVEFMEKASPALQVRTPSTQTPPQSAEPTDQMDDTMDFAVNEGHGVAEESVMVPAEEKKELDLLEKFLPPPPKEKCSDELQEKIMKFLALKKTAGRSFNAEVRNRKEYRNPDFLLHSVTYQDIDQIGSCFSKDVFDPHGYDKSDFYDEIEADSKREMDRREQERRRSPKVDFISGGTQPAPMVPTPKINLSIPGMAPVALPPTVDVVTRDGRQNKKSKWDKVDGDRRDPVSAVGAHAALLSAANAGAGYTAFAQQRRREAEEKRPSDKKLDRRS